MFVMAQGQDRTLQAGWAGNWMGKCLTECLGSEDKGYGVALCLEDGNDIFMSWKRRSTSRYGNTGAVPTPQWSLVQKDLSWFSLNLHVFQEVERNLGWKGSLEVSCPIPFKSRNNSELRSGCSRLHSVTFSPVVQATDGHSIHPWGMLYVTNHQS